MSGYTQAGEKVGKQGKILYVFWGRAGAGGGGTEQGCKRKNGGGGVPEAFYYVSL